MATPIIIMRFITKVNEQYANGRLVGMVEEGVISRATQLQSSTPSGTTTPGSGKRIPKHMKGQELTCTCMNMFILCLYFTQTYMYICWYIMHIIYTDRYVYIILLYLQEQLVCAPKLSRVRWTQVMFNFTSDSSAKLILQQIHAIWNSHQYAAWTPKYCVVAPGA